MSAKQAAAIDARGDSHKEGGCWVAGRYRVQEELGRGGMGAVYRVVDRSTRRTLALKQPISERPGTGSQRLELFQREYHTLVQLAHPFIIQVYEYGVDRGNPYYTMELLDGGDLRAMAPVEWKRACALLRDVASSLAIVHSRRMVHRDVSPRNVRCTKDGRAKLLDFGAMVPMGPVKRVVGTPPFVPPEALNHQPLDGRADLFSLGGLAHWLLTGRHAYPARNLEQLRDVWRSRQPEPSALAPDIPPALNSLVISLLSLDRLGRPVTAAEVFDRLTAIAGLPDDEPLGVSQAYLTTPSLVGRGRQLARCRKLVLRGVRGGGATLLIKGDPGMGRSRLLMACILDAKIAGATVLGASSEDSDRGAYGVVRALVDDLLEALPDPALNVARDYGDILGHVLPELHERLGRPELAVVEDPKLLRQRVQTALTEFVASLAVEYPLLVAVDDVHRCDEASVAVLTALSRFGRNARSPALVLALTAERQTEARAASRALKMLEEIGTRITLRAFDRKKTQQLMVSVFGDVPNLTALADWVYGLSQGNPRTCMELAQHVVDQSIARYEGGQWVLPDGLQGLALPQSLEQALDARVGALSESARALAETLSLASWGALHKLKDCMALWQGSEQQGVFAALGELVAAQVLVGTGDAYTFRQEGLIQALHRGMGEERRREIHGRLAAVCEATTPDNPWALIYHLQQAGQTARSLDLLLAQAQEAGAAVGAYALQVQCCETGLALAEELQRSPREIYFIRKALLLLASRHDPALLRHAHQAEEQLRNDSGRVFWEQLEDALEPTERIQRCLNMAQSKWESLPESQRGLSPLEAVRELAVHAVFVSSAAGRSADTESVARLPALVAPLRTLAPAIDVLVRLLESIHDAVCGKSVRDSRLEIEQSLGRAVPGMSDVVRERTRHITSYHVALDELLAGEVGSALERAQKLEANASFVANAWQIRMLAHLSEGNAGKAERCRERFELLALQNPESDPHLVSGALYEVVFLSMCGDLMGLKRVLTYVAQMAEQLPGWVPYFLAVRGECHRLRGKLDRALADLQRAAGLAPPGVHHAWLLIMTRLTQTLVDRGEIERARDLAAHAIEQSQARALNSAGRWRLEAILAVAEAKLGQHAEAAARMDRLIEQAKAAAQGPLVLGNLYEARVRVVMAAGDEDAFAEWARLTAGQYRPLNNPALIARYERLMAEAAQRDFQPDTHVQAAMLDTADTASTLAATGTLVTE